MDTEIEKQILDELRCQTALFKKSKKTSGIFIVALLIILSVSVSRHWMPDRFKAVSQPVDTWIEARNILNKGDYQKSTEMIQRLLKKHPDYYYGYYLLGSLNQEMGNLSEAEANYAKAYDLFPTEDNGKDLAAIRKAIEKKKKAANQASEAIAPPGGAQPQR
jgi:tetratricopeptide (TPR) repeat protein